MGSAPASAEYEGMPLLFFAEPTMQLQAPFVDAEAAAPLPAVIAILPSDERRGCGWFDSTYELSAGLCVTEDIDPTLFELWAMLPIEAKPVLTLH